MTTPTLPTPAQAAVLRTMADGPHHWCALCDRRRTLGTLCDRGFIVAHDNKMRWALTPAGRAALKAYEEKL